MRQPMSSNSKAEQNDKTAPRGMAPDKAHASREMTAERRKETEETFNDSPQNAEAKQTRHPK